MTIINIDRLKIYRNYNGDIDSILRRNKKSELDAFGPEIDKIWGKITSVIQDLELIEKGLTSKEYMDRFISEVKVICDDLVYTELMRNVLVNKITLIDIIKDYQLSVDKTVNIFKNKYKVNDILEGWHNKIYDQTGKLLEEGLYFYAFHGIGLAARFKDKIVDFDFAYFPEPRHDGFDLWRLTNFIQNQRNKYPEYKEKEKIENEFNELIKKRVIAKPKLENSNTLYFFSDTIMKEMDREISNNETIPKPKKTLVQKLFGFKI
jgi:hypothetical protein